MADFSYVDNLVPFGSRVETINDVAYVMENISLSKPGKVTDRLNQIGQPNGFFVVNAPIHGTAVIQIPTADTAYPEIGDTFTDTFGAVTGTFVVVDITQPYAMHDYYKANITFRYSPNPPA